MWYFNLAVAGFFDLLLTPFRSLHPFWSLMTFSLLTGIFMLLIFRYTSNQKGIRETKNRIKAHLMEVRLFKDDLGILLSAQKNLLIYNVRYVMHAVKPMLVMIVPVSILLIHLHVWFGHRPLKIGETSIFTVEAKNEGRDALSDISIKADDGLIVETPPLRIPEEGKVHWRIRANGLGDHNMTVKASYYKFQKKVFVSDGRLSRVSPRVVTSSLWDTILNPGEKPMSENGLVKQIEVYYPSRSVEIFGRKIHWLVVFFVLSIVFGFAFKGFFGVEL